MKKAREKRYPLFERSWASCILFGLALVMLVLIVLAQVYPLLWMINTSLRTDIEVFINMFGPPNALHFENYSSVWDLIGVDVFIEGHGYVRYNIGRLLGNSVLIAVLMPIKGTVSSVITAYIIAKYKFKGSGILVGINIFVMILPIVGSLPSQLKIYNVLGMYDNFVMQALLGASPFGFGLLVYIGMFKGVPDAYLEAARIDGAGHFRTFVQIALPPVLPTVAVFYLLAVLGSWNDYQTPLMWLPSYANLAYGMFQFQYDTAKYASTLPQIMAGFVIVSVPSVIFYFCNQKLITSKMMVGGLKGEKNIRSGL